MATAARARIMLESLDEKVEGLKAAVNKLDAAAQQVSADQDQEATKRPAEPKPEAAAASHS